MVACVTWFVADGAVHSDPATGVARVSGLAVWLSVSLLNVRSAGNHMRYHELSDNMMKGYLRMTVSREACSTALVAASCPSSDLGCVDPVIRWLDIAPRWNIADDDYRSLSTAYGSADGLTCMPPAPPGYERVRPFWRSPAAAMAISTAICSGARPAVSTAAASATNPGVMLKSAPITTYNKVGYDAVASLAASATSNGCEANTPRCAIGSSWVNAISTIAAMMEAPLWAS
jgi:hypothetical protein